MKYKKLKKLDKEDEFLPYKKLLIGKEFIVQDTGDCKLRYKEDYLAIQSVLDNYFWFLPHKDLWYE